MLWNIVLKCFTTTRLCSVYQSTCWRMEQFCLQLSPHSYRYWSWYLEIPFRCILMAWTLHLFKSSHDLRVVCSKISYNLTTFSSKFRGRLFPNLWTKDNAMSFNLQDLEAALPDTQEQQQGWGTPLPTTPMLTQPSQIHAYDQYILQFEKWREQVAQEDQRVGPPLISLREDYFTRLAPIHTQPSFAAIPPRDQPHHTPKMSSFRSTAPSNSPSSPSSSSSNGGYHPLPLPRVNIPQSILRPTLETRSATPKETGGAGLGKSIMDMFDRDKTKFIQCLRTIHLFIAGFNTEPTHFQQILLVLSYMKDDNAAGRFTDLFVLTNSEQMWIMTIDEFIGGLAEMFIPAALGWQAKKELYALNQGKGTVEVYLIHMKQLAMQAGYDIDTHTKTLVRLMWQGLKNNIVEYVERGRLTTSKNGKKHSSVQTRFFEKLKIKRKEAGKPPSKIDMEWQHNG